MDKLKPCPFCGGQAHFRPDLPEGFEVDTESRDQAVELWNKRSGGADDAAD